MKQLLRILIWTIMSAFVSQAQTSFWQVSDSSQIFVRNFAFDQSVGMIAGGSTGLFKSTDHGITWTNINNGIPKGDFFFEIGCVSIDPWRKTVYVGGAYGLYRSNDNGQSWTKLGDGYMYDTQLSIRRDGQMLWVNTGDNTFRMSTDGGNTFQIVSATTIRGPLPTAYSVVVNRAGKDWYVGTTAGILRVQPVRSSNLRMLRISYIRSVNEWIRQIVGNSSGKMVALGRKNLFVSRDDGRSWRKVTQDTAFSIRRIAIDERGNLFATASSTSKEGRYFEIVLLSNNDGLTWERFNSGLPPADQLGAYDDAIAFSSDGYLFAAIHLFGIFRTSLSAGILPPRADAGEIRDGFRTSFGLHQNYPNPFNPKTAIEFKLAKEARVTVKIYNTLGQEVAELIHSELMDEGIQELEFDGSNLPSGGYYCRIVAQDIETGQLQFTSVKNMMMIK